MLSDESSSDSETGRFKCHSEKQEDKAQSSRREDKFRSSGRRPSERNKYSKDLDRQRFERARYGRRSPDRHRPPRHSPNDVRRRSRDRSAGGYRSADRHRHGRHSRTRDNRSRSRDRKRESLSQSRRTSDVKRIVKEEVKKDIADDTIRSSSREKRSKSTDRKASNSEYNTKRSEVYKLSPGKSSRKTQSPIEIKDQGESDAAYDDIQPGSYYSMIPVVDKKSDESSVTDSSDDERLRAKLLNLEQKLDKTKKRKHKKKHRRKSSKSKNKDKEGSSAVEVSSTTDIPENGKDQDVIEAEVSSTQSKCNKKETSEEGEITSDDEDKQMETIEIDPTDLRHKLKRTAPKETSKSPDLRERLKLKSNVCGPALPPQVDITLDESVSPEIEGPALPPHLQRKVKEVGPSLPSEMRKVLAETAHPIIAYESSDEDDGIGPLPVGSEDKWTNAHQQLEERALDMKIKKLDGHSTQTDVKKREKWMLELPEGKAKYLGLEARSFRAKEGPDMSDRSSWTDTPEQKERKVKGLPPPEEDAKDALQREAHAKHINLRDNEQEQAVKKHKKKHKRDESLLDMHQKKLKKKKKKDEKEHDKKERRPFSRDTDLQVNRFDEAQKSAIIKKAQNLDSRFSRGEAKYL